MDRLKAQTLRDLRRMSAKQSLEIGRALWNSDLARIARWPAAPRPPSLAIALGLQRRGRVVR